jgi:hypothetical protein
MTVAIICAVVAFAAVAWHVVSTIMIVNWLHKKGQKINFGLIKALAPAYAHRYKKMTLEETGNVGTLYYHWLISINVALVAGILAVGFMIAGHRR